MSSSGLGSGMNDVVWALVLNGSGSLYAGGGFTTAGGRPSRYIAHWSWVTEYTVYLPGLLREYPANPYEEDDTPGDATGPMANGVWYYAYPNDQDDYYYFTLATQAAVTVRVADFTATQGHLMVLDSGLGLVAHTTNQGHPSSMELTAQLGPGSYYVRVYAQGNLNTQTLYRLQVAWSP